MYVYSIQLASVYVCRFRVYLFIYFITHVIFPRNSELGRLDARAGFPLFFSLLFVWRVHLVRVK